jgi:hypothetical protein
VAIAVVVVIVVSYESRGPFRTLFNLEVCNNTLIRFCVAICGCRHGYVNSMCVMICYNCGRTCLYSLLLACLGCEVVNFNLEMLLVLLKKFYVYRMRRLHAPGWRFRRLQTQNFLYVLNLSYASWFTMWHRCFAPHDSMNTMYPSHFLLIYAKCLEETFVEVQINIAYIKGEPLYSCYQKLNLSIKCKL